MWDFSIFKALALWARTAPFLLVRVVAYGAIALVLAFATLAGAWGGHWLAGLGVVAAPGPLALWGGVIGFGIAAGVALSRRSVLLHRVRAGHVAAMVDRVDGRRLPFGMAQVAQARSEVADRFGPAPELLALDRLIRRVGGIVPRVADEIGPILGFPGLNRVVTAGLLDEVILAHAFRARPENAWEAAHDGLVLLTQNARTMLGTAGWITLIGWIATGAVFLFLLAPLAGLAWLWPGAGATGNLALAALGAWAVRAALIQPFALACLLQAFLRTTAGQDPLPEWRGRLTQVSDPFRQLGERAVAWTPETGAVA